MRSALIQIKLLYFDGCPSWQPALENLKMAIAAEKIAAEISLVKIECTEQAQQERFLGSPSFLVDGIDLWPEERNQYTLSCRVYHTPTGLRGAPSIEVLRLRLQEIIQTAGGTS